MIKTYIRIYKEKIKKLFCRTGIHWMQNHQRHFIDKITGGDVYLATCPCGGQWMVDSLFPIVTFKVETEISMKRRNTKQINKEAN